MSLRGRLKEKKRTILKDHGKLPVVANEWSILLLCPYGALKRSVCLQPLTGVKKTRGLLCEEKQQDVLAVDLVLSSSHHRSSALPLLCHNKSGRSCPFKQANAPLGLIIDS